MEPIYVIDPAYSGVAGYATQEEAEAYVQAVPRAAIVPATQVSSDVRGYHKRRLGMS